MEELTIEETAKAIGIPCIVIDEDFDWSKMPSLAELFPQSLERKEPGAEHVIAAEIWHYLYDHTTLGESMYYFDKESRDQTIRDIAYFIRRKADEL